MESCHIKAVFNTDSKTLYDSWLSVEGHTAMTGGEATCSDRVGDSFIAWDGYIWGKNLELIPHQKIVQSWRTTEFSEKDEDSRVEIRLQKVSEGTQFEIIHTNIPSGQTQYEQGWIDHYINPMKDYFNN